MTLADLAEHCGIPQSVWDSYERKVAQGYPLHLTPDELRLHELLKAYMFGVQPSGFYGPSVIDMLDVADGPEYPWVEISWGPSHGFRERDERARVLADQANETIATHVKGWWNFGFDPEDQLMDLTEENMLRVIERMTPEEREAIMKRPRLMDMPKHKTIEIEDALARVEAKTHPRVKPSDIENKIVDVAYLRHRHLVICVITMNNGYIVTGESAPVDPRNFDEDVGKKFAYDIAFNKLWPLEGYLLCEVLQSQREGADDE